MKTFTLAVLILLGIWSATISARVMADTGREPVKRTVLALYDGNTVHDVRLTRVHRFAEMPLNYLGLKIRYWNIQDGLPGRYALNDVRGIISWFNANDLDNPKVFFSWASDVVELGIKYVFFGNPDTVTQHESDADARATNKFLGKFGLRSLGHFTDVTFDAEVVSEDVNLIGFERPLVGLLPGFGHYTKTSDVVFSHVVVRSENIHELESHVVVSGPNGGFVEAGYALYEDSTTGIYRWLLNPFAYFRVVFTTDDVPKVDPSTLSNRRVFFSHVDGDGWLVKSDIYRYKQLDATASEVIYKEVLTKYRDLPVSIAPIAGDLDRKWKGTSKAIQTAKHVFRLPHVEAASHTYSHPFSWRFYRRYTPMKEKEFLVERNSGTFLGSIIQQVVGAESLDDEVCSGDEEIVGEEAEPPRAYFVEAFDLQKEIKGSVDLVNALLPSHKRVTLIQWTGDTLPFESALSTASKLGIKNMNGGNNVRGNDYLSFSSISSFGVQLGKEVQIYGENRNEKRLVSHPLNVFKRIVNKSETPHRIRPLSIYYHAATGRHQARLNRLRAVLDYVRTQEVAPTTTSHYASMVEGFYSADVYRIGEQAWQIENRGDLQTIRFDRATLLSVDFKRSAGVIGQRHYQGSLYVLLDPAVADVKIGLKQVNSPEIAPTAPVAYLIQSQWLISDVDSYENDAFQFRATGYGSGEMEWWVPAVGRYKINVRSEGETVWSEIVQSDAERRLAFVVATTSANALAINVSKLTDDS